ncbi:TrgA family protein [Roseicyclus sediminis]|uniref:TrgA family protein n=1 Tax=Roseicyclus sediminis TaxID=2980997 RepID=UPI0021D2BA77|nr:TrgA family protein [Roseibacterium sp. SDUM158016]
MFFDPQTQSGMPKRQMPTAAKLVAAILFFVVGWQAATFTLLTFPPEMAATYFPLSIAMIGLWQGWMVSGSRAGQGVGVALGNGVRCGVQVAFFGILLFALRTMFMRSANLRYDSPGEAVIATLDLFLQYFLQTLEIPHIWATLLIGGAIAGLLTEAAGRLWR